MKPTWLDRLAAVALLAGPVAALNDASRVLTRGDGSALLLSIVVFTALVPLAALVWAGAATKSDSNSYAAVATLAILDAALAMGCVGLRKYLVLFGAHAT